MEYNFKDLKSWVNPQDLKEFEKDIRSFVYTKNGKVRKQLLKDIEKLNTGPEPEEFIDSLVKKFQSAHRLKAYMDFRAFNEKLKHEFDTKFYHDGFKKGCFEFFGVKCCACCGKIIKDTQNPDAYSRFVKHEKELEEPTVH
jgi:hypothetical protein